MIESRMTIKRLAKRGQNIAAIAFANKLPRTGAAVWHYEIDFDPVSPNRRLRGRTYRIRVLESVQQARRRCEMRAIDLPD
jgi:hypothetical protein